MRPFPYPQGREMWKGEQGIVCARPQSVMLEHSSDKDRMPTFRGPQHSNGREGGREREKRRGGEGEIQLWLGNTASIKIHYSFN